MDKEDYVGLLEVRCKFYTDHDYVPVRGGSPIFVPANWGERIFFRIVVPDFNAPQAQLTGSRVHVAKLWDEQKTMADIEDDTGIGTCLDSMSSNRVEEIVKACMDLRKPESSEERYLPYNRRNYIIGFPKPIIGVFVRFDSEDILRRLSPYSSEHYSNYHEMHIAKIEKHDSYIPVENILGYETPRRFTERRDGFTGEMLVDWPPTVEYAESLTGIKIAS